MISDSTRAAVCAAADNRCGYCLTQQRLAMQVLEIEHITLKHQVVQTKKKIYGSLVGFAITQKAFKRIAMILPPGI
jgi:hypothetical protein